MTTREAPAEPVTQEQVQELPRDVSPYLQALVLAYLATGGEDSEQTNRRAYLFRKALAAAAIGAFVFRDRDQGAAADIDFTETAEPFTAAVKDAVAEYQARDDRDPEQDSKFAESVANTLSTGAANRLTLEVLNQLDPSGAAYKKLWLTRADDKVRLSHRELHGRTASVGEPFKKGLNYPGDPTAPLDERINCRCFLFAVPSDKDVETANAFEPADLTTAFAASAALHAVTAGNMLRQLMHLAPWTWQPRDSIGRWVEVGDVMHAPSSSGKGKERGRVVEIIGRNRVKLESIRFPGRTWDVDSRDTAPDFSKANLPHLQPIPNPRIERGRRSERLPPEFGPLTPEIRNRPVFRQVRPEIVGLTENEAGAPIFEPTELEPGQVVVLESKSNPGRFRHMVVDEIDELGRSALLSYPPEPRFQVAGEEDERIFQLQSPAARQFVRLDDGVLYEATNPQLVEEVNMRMEAARYGFANPYWFGSTYEAFSTGEGRDDWVPERKVLHDRIIAEGFGEARPAQGPANFYMMGGGPSSGKSTMLMADAVDVPIGDEGIQINADDIKTYLPEYVGLMEADQRRAAAFVHEESSQISTRMIQESPQDKHVVLDGVGDKGAGSVENRLRTAKSRNQRTIANYATLPTEMAVRLSAARGEQTGRYVPEDYIRRAHADVTDTFFDLAKARSLDELYLWNTELWDEDRKVGIPRLIFSQVDGVSEIHDEALLLEFLNKSRTKRHSYQSIAALTGDSGFAFTPPPLTTVPPIVVPGGEVPAAPAGLAAAAEGDYDMVADDENLWYGLDWDTLNLALIEVAAELGGAQYSPRLPTDDPQINALKDRLRVEFADPAKQIAIFEP